MAYSLPHTLQENVIDITERHQLHSLHASQDAFLGQEEMVILNIFYIWCILHIYINVTSYSFDFFSFFFHLSMGQWFPVHHCLRAPRTSTSIVCHCGISHIGPTTRAVFLLFQWGRRARYPLTCEENLPTFQGRPATNPITAATVPGGGTSTAGPSPGATIDGGNKLAEIMRRDLCLMLYVQHAQYAIYDSTQTIGICMNMYNMYNMHFILHV